MKEEEEEEEEEEEVEEEEEEEEEDLPTSRSQRSLRENEKTFSPTPAGSASATRTGRRTSRKGRDRRA